MFIVYPTKTLFFFSMLYQLAGFRLHWPQHLRRSMQLLWWMRILQVLWSPWRCLWLSLGFPFFLTAGKDYEKYKNWIDEINPGNSPENLLTWPSHSLFCFWEIFCWTHIKTHLDIKTSRPARTKTRTNCNKSLGGGFKQFLFSPQFGEDSHFDEYFSKGLKPPTSSFFFQENIQEQPMELCSQ